MKSWNVKWRAVCVAALLAVSSASAATQGNPDEVAQHARAAQQAQRNGDFATAIREYTALSRLMPDRADVYSNLGVAYFFHQDPASALDAFDKALRLNPSLVSALIFAGIANQQLSRPARATPLLERAIALKPDDVLAQTWLGHGYAAQGRYREAIDRFRRAAEQSPRDVDIWYGLGQAWLQLGRQETAQLLALAPQGARVLQMAGDLWLLRGSPDHAIALYREALKTNPRLTELAEFVAAQRDRPTAPSPTDLRPPRARPATPPTPEDAHYMAATDAREQARRAFEQIPAVGPNSHRAHQVLAESLLVQERNAEALAEYRAAIGLKPDVVGVHLAVGNLLMSEGKATEALDAYRQELRLRPEDAEVHYRIGRALAFAGRDAEAEASLKRALASSHPPPAVHRELGKIALGRRQFTEAAKSLTTYLASNANDATAHYLLMRAYRGLGDTAAAERQLAIYKTLSDPQQRQAAIQKALELFTPDKEPK